MESYAQQQNEQQFNYATEEKQTFLCNACNRTFSTKGGRTNHQRKCKQNVANVESNTQNQGEEIEKKGEKEAPVLSSNTNDQNTDVTDSEHLFQQQQRQQQQHVTSWKPPMIFNWGEYDGTIFTNHL